MAAGLAAVFAFPMRHGDERIGALEDRKRFAMAPQCDERASLAEAPLPRTAAGTAGSETRLR